MAHSCRHACRCNRRSERHREDNADIITDRSDCCAAQDTLAEEFYGGDNEHVLMMNCCDPEYGCDHFDSRKRCDYWPAFAHPRWLTCRELYDN